MTYRFGTLSFDAALGELRDGDEAVKLEPLVLQLVAYLIQNADRIVSKDELIQHVWGGTIVSDAAVNSRINAARKAFGDDGKRQAVIKTYPKRGFRFVAEFETDVPTAGTASGDGSAEGWAQEDASTVLPPTEQPAPRASRGWIGLLALFAVVILGGAILWHRSETTVTAPQIAEDTNTPMSERPRIAVLPFDDFSGEASTSRLAWGITEDIITDLARFPEFGVIARNSAAVYAGKPTDMRQIGSDLDVDYVLEGSIQKDAQTIRITAQLIKTYDGTHIWTDRWDRPAEDLFAIQSEISTTVANRLGGGAGIIQEAGRAKARRKQPEHLDAYELYLLGTERLEELTKESIQEAIALLERAVEIEPSLARAWVELYHAHNLSRYYGMDKETALEAAFSAATKAVELDPSDAEAHSAQAMALADKGDFSGAKSEFEKSLSLAPNSFEILAFYASWAGSLGEPELGAELAERAVSLNPAFPDWAASPFSWAFFTVGRYEDAIEMLDRLSPEAYSSWRWAVKAGSQAALGRSEEAAETVRQALQFFPDLTIEGLIDNIGLTDVEMDRWIETMRVAGFPACAPAEERGEIGSQYRLSECGPAE